MAKFVKCNKCLREYIWYKCPNWCNEITEEIKPKEIIKQIVTKPEVKLQEKVTIVKPKEVIKTSEDLINWLPLYKSNYLNKVLKKNLNSIKNQTCCIEYKWKYILHEDIINQFKNSLPK